jgi:hypothetical protein
MVLHVFAVGEKTPAAVPTQANEPAGEILQMDYDPRGQLVVRAKVSHPEARRCGHFSIACTVREWRLCEIDDPRRFHGEIRQADIDEISLTPTPCNEKRRRGFTN